MKIGDQISKELEDNLRSVAKVKDDLWIGLTIVKRWEATMTTKQSINRWISTFCLASGYSDEERKTFTIPAVYDNKLDPKTPYLYGFLVGKKTIIYDTKALELNKSGIVRTALLFDTALNPDFVARVAALDDEELMTILLAPLMIRIILARFQYFTENDQEDKIPMEWQTAIMTVSDALEKNTLWGLTYCRLGESEISTASNILKIITPLLTGSEYDSKFLLNERYLYGFLSASMYALRNKEPFFSDGAYDSPMRIFVEALVVARKSSRQFATEKTKRMLKESSSAAVKYIETTFNSQWNATYARYADLSDYTFLQRYSTLTILLNGRRQLTEIPHAVYDDWILTYESKKRKVSKEEIAADSNKVKPPMTENKNKNRNHRDRESFVEFQNPTENSDPWLAFMDRNIFR